MNTYALSNEEILATGFTHVVQFYNEDLQAAITGSPTTATIAIFPESGTFPAGTAVLRAGMTNPGAAGDWASPTGTLFTVEMGDDGNTDRLLTAQDILANGSPKSHYVESQNTATLPYAYTAANTIDITFTIADDTLDDVTCPDGNPLNFYLHVVNLNAVVQ